MHWQHLFFRRPSRTRALTLAFTSLLTAGCGQTGAPLPPSLQLPEIVADLSAVRIANKVELKWTMPRRTTDKLPLKGQQAVRICRRIADGPCVDIANVSFPPEKLAAYEDALPPELSTGGPQLLAYSVDVLSRQGRSAGASNLAYTAAGLAPPSFVDARAQIQSEGVVLQWQPAALSSNANSVNIQRTLLSIPSKQTDQVKSPFAPASEPIVKRQSLTVHLPPGDDPGKAVDPDAEFDQRYSYTLARSESMTLAGKSIEVQGLPSPEIIVDTKDTFPPAAPAGLAAVAVPREGAVDLSWAPNTERDVAGYAVYRREGSSQPVRLSDRSKPLDAPAFRDETAVRGREYAYYVTAIDRDGNESKPSTETAETIPPKP